jgi:hypothetical protein
MAWRYDRNAAVGPRLLPERRGTDEVRVNLWTPLIGKRRFLA